MNLSAGKPFVWIAAGLVIAALEMIIPGNVIIWFGAAAVLTGLLAFLVHNTYVLFGFFLLASGLMVFLAQWIGRKITRPEPAPVGANRFDGVEAVVMAEIRPSEPGRVKVFGEEWRAESDEVLKKGERVRVVKVDGTRLIVERKTEGS
ncbi:MAG: NfeD family protein [candidate division WOR-3 bacterium]